MTYNVFGGMLNLPQSMLVTAVTYPTCHTVQHSHFVTHLWPTNNNRKLDGLDSKLSTSVS